MRAHDQAHSHARGPMILIWQGYASDRQDVQTVSHTYPRHPERSKRLGTTGTRGRRCPSQHKEVDTSDRTRSLTPARLIEPTSTASGRWCGRHEILAAAA